MNNQTLPAWLETEEARELRKDFPDDKHTCDECGLPFWVCNVICEMGIDARAKTDDRRAFDDRRLALEAEARAIFGDKREEAAE